MTGVDVAIIVFCLLLALAGYRQGLVVGLLSLAGFAVGAVIGTRIGALVVPDGSRSPYAPLAGLAGAVVIGGLLAIAFEGLGLAIRMRVERRPSLAAVDGAFGSLLLGALGLGIAWIAAAVVAQTPGATDLRTDVQRSAILQRLNDVLPPSGPLLNALARFDPFPEISGPAARVPAPATGTARDPQVRAAAASVVRVTGSACGLGVEGSGWIVRRGIVVTNAHVVAGEEDTSVQLRGVGDHLDATVVGFDSRNDIAILSVPGLDDAPALETAGEPREGASAAILGFPRNGPYDVRNARVAQTQDVLSQDAYGAGPIKRAITTVRGYVRPGNSGGPVVDARGRVVATVFAASRSSRVRTGYAIPNDVVEDVLRGIDGPVGTGGCAP